jgi:hypothetical protein
MFHEVPHFARFLESELCWQRIFGGIPIVPACQIETHVRLELFVGYNPHREVKMLLFPIPLFLLSMQPFFLETFSYNMSVSSGSLRSLIATYGYEQGRPPQLPEPKSRRSCSFEDRPACKHSSIAS